MKTFIILMGLGALVLIALGLFFVFPIGFVAVPFLVIPGFAIYSLYRFFDENQGTYKRRGVSTSAATNLVTGFDDGKIDKPAVDVYANGHWSEGSTFSGELKERIENFLEQFPSDSNCTVKLSRFGARWLIRFTINSVQTRFTALGLSKDLNTAVASAERQLVDQLEIWRKDRFANSKWMKNVESRVLTTISESVGRPVRVLIVDDDVDAALLIDSVFREKGCETRLALTVQEAREMIARMDSDIVVLDWRLSKDVNADSVLTESIAKLEAKQENVDIIVPKVVTYSNLNDSEIQFPESKFFDHVGHWKKPINYSELSNKTKGVIEAASF